MHKKTHYHQVRFSPETITEARDRINALLDNKQRSTVSTSLLVDLGKEHWSHDSEGEFFADYRRNPRWANYHYSGEYGKFGLDVMFIHPCTDVTVTAPARGEIEDIQEIFERAAPDAAIPSDDEEEKRPVVFIGHGGSQQWRDLKDHLHDHHGYHIQAYEVGARAGHAIRDILEEMMAESSFAVLVMTGEDSDDQGRMHARDNVIHELGLFQGKLGFSRAIVLLEEGTQEFSNIHGIHQIRYSKGNIRETFGDVLATLRREFEPRIQRA